MYFVVLRALWKRLSESPTSQLVDLPSLTVFVSTLVAITSKGTEDWFNGRSASFSSTEHCTRVSIAIARPGMYNLLFIFIRYWSDFLEIDLTRIIPPIIDHSAGTLEERNIR